MLGLKNAEEAHVCAMFRNLGHQLVTHYLPEDYEAMKRLMETQGMTIDAAATQVLGVSLRKLSIGVMQKWRMSPRIAASMTPDVTGAKVKNDDDRLRLLSAFSNELCATVATTPEAEREQAITGLLARYKGVLNMPPKQVPGLLSSVHDTFKDRYATLLNLDPEKSALFRNARAMTARAAEVEPTAGSAVPAKPTEGVEVARAEPMVVPTPAGPKGALIEKRLGEIEALVHEAHDPIDALRLILEAFGTAFSLRRALILAPGKERATLRVLSAWGEDAKLLREEFTLPLSSSLANDVFSVAWHTGQSVVISDAFDDKSTSRIPRVYYEFLGSMAFGIYPCLARSAGARLLFADSDSPQALPSPEDLPYVNHFRALIERNANSPPAQQKEIRPLAPKRI
jgi:hypothetical protein